MCACPGSKTTHIATNFMRGRGVLVACERNRGKLKRLKTLSRTLGMERCIVPTLADSTACVYGDARVATRVAAAAGATAGAAAAKDTVASSREVGAATTGAGEGVMGVGAAQRGSVDATGTGTGTGAEPVETTNGIYRGARGRCLFKAESFDRILLDPPCSALGLRPKLAQEATSESLLSSQQLAKAFLHQAVQLLKPGGTSANRLLTCLCVCVCVCVCV